MNSSSYGCQITQNGASGSYTYDFSGLPSGTEADWANRPVNYVSWYDSLRFSNWLHNGQLTGSQDASTTEDGAYDMSGSSVVRKAGAQVWLPSADEWYKAAYHENDGATGSYFVYPTSSDSLPSNDLVNPDPGNNATFYDGGYTIGSPYYRTEVGDHENCESPYGTFDQGGNVQEWNEEILGSYRGMRGGSFASGGAYDLRNIGERYYYDPALEYGSFGFRVASVPEPCSLVLLGLGGLTLMRRRRVR
jgi:formylglycine-generating enzyme required for sulfatase activity